MPVQKATLAAYHVIEGARAELTAELVAELAEPLAEYILNDYEREDWQDSPLVETLGRVAAVLEAQGQEVPRPILDVLRTATQAGRPVGVA
jgi:hypothetical protein